MSDTDAVHKVQIVNGAEVGAKSIGDAPPVSPTIDSALQKYWRPLLAVVYMLICLFDFIIAPAYVGLTRESLAEKVNAMKGVPVEVMLVFSNKPTGWDPLTLMYGGLFHMAFGVVLTGSAVTRGMEKIQREKI